MTSRERVDAAFRHQNVDRTPMFEYVLLPPVAEQILGRAYVDYAGDGAGWLSMAQDIGWERAIRQYVRDRLDLAEILGHDLLYVVPNPMLPAAETPLPAEPSHPDDPVARLRYRVEQSEAQECCLNDANYLVYDELQQEMSRRGLDLPVMVPAYAHGIWTNTDLMQTMLLEPEWAHRHFRLATQRTQFQVKHYLDLGLRLIGVGGDFAGNRPLISPAAYRDFIMPEVRAICRQVHAGGGFAINASDGNLWSVIDDFLLGTEVDGYLEIDLNAGMDLPRLKRQFGNRITFLGNMDCGNTLSFASPAVIRQQTRDCLDAGQGRGGHIFCASNAITASVPLDHYLAMINTYREFFNQPPLAIKAG